MSTLRDYISSIKSMFKMTSSDVVISDRGIASELLYVKNLLIKRETDARKLFNSPNFFSEINCLEMERVPLSECASYYAECYIAKSKLALPKIAENKRGLLMQGVFSIDKRVRFNDVNNPTRFINYLTLYPNGKEKFYWISPDNHLYITDPNIELVTLIAHFSAPLDSTAYNSCEDASACPTNPLDLEFKIPNYLESPLMDMTQERLKKIYSSSVEDLQEDDKDQTQ